MPPMRLRCLCILLMALLATVAGSLAGRHPLRHTVYGAALFWAASSLFYYITLARGDTLDHAAPTTSSTIRAAYSTSSLLIP